MTPRQFNSTCIGLHRLGRLLAIVGVILVLGLASIWLNAQPTRMPLDLKRFTSGIMMMANVFIVAGLVMVLYDETIGSWLSRMGFGK